MVVDYWQGLGTGGTRPVGAARLLVTDHSLILKALALWITLQLTGGHSLEMPQNFEALPNLLTLLLLLLASVGAGAALVDSLVNVLHLGVEIV